MDSVVGAAAMARLSCSEPEQGWLGRECPHARRVGAWAGVVGLSVFVLVFLVEDWARPKYNPAADYVTALALGERGWVQVTSFFIVGVCLLLFTAAASREFPSGAASRTGPILLGCIGAGLLLSGPL
jgi:hypothetical protein